MAITDRARDFWDRISPRERALVVLLAIGVPIAGGVWLALSIHDGLVTMDQRNDQMRDALEIIQHEKGKGPQATPDDAPKIPAEPERLEAYVTKAAEKFSLKFKGPIDSRPKATKNGFVTSTVSCAIDSISTDELKAFLQEVETTNKLVVTTHLEVRRNFRDRKKIDATFEISTYSLEKPKAGAGSGAEADGKKDG
jgi:type II secretion system (T2SS) protein M